MLGSPVLVGAITLLVAIVAVFLSYNANSGLPFVPTYDLKAEFADAANLVVGNDVRIGGQRVGAVSEITPVPSDGDSPPTAEVEVKLEKQVDPLPVDSTMIIRPRSALGLKYIEITPGKSEEGFSAGDTIPDSQAKPKPVEIDDVFNTFDVKARRGSQRTLDGFGNALAGRGDDINEAIVDLRPLLIFLQPVAVNLSDPDTQLARFFQSLERAAAEVAPVAETQASLFINLDTTFTALASVARPFIQQSISNSPPAEDAAIRGFPQQRPFLRNSTALFRELKPGVAVLPSSAPVLADALEIGTRTLARTPGFNEDLEDVFVALKNFAEEPLVRPGIQRLNDTVESLRPTLRFVTPAQTVCNYATLWFRNVSSLLSVGDQNGTWQRFIIIATPQGPNNEGGPSSAPANGGGPDASANFLHANSYPNTAAPGQTRECEAGNEVFKVGQQAIGNVPGNQGTETDGQVEGQG
jgi:phospholipid/cholesterol/gamma-HCH transport system substrate-binding protein